MNSFGIYNLRLKVNNRIINKYDMEEAESTKINPSLFYFCVHTRISCHIRKTHTRKSKLSFEFGWKECTCLREAIMNLLLVLSFFLNIIVEQFTHSKDSQCTVQYIYEWMSERNETTNMKLCSLFLVKCLM